MVQRNSLEAACGQGGRGTRDDGRRRCGEGEVLNKLATRHPTIFEFPKKHRNNLFHGSDLFVLERYYPTAMAETDRPQERPNYGIDAPDVVRNLFLAGIVGLSLWALTLVLGLSGFIIPRPVLVLTGMGLTTGIGCSLMALWMLWHSRVGKLRARERLLDLISWSGHEQALDVGCGRGLLLVGVAKRLTTGRAIGIDIWQAEDLTGNSP